jgi:hypothetical protein
LVALVSWGEECADEQFPGVNSRISDSYDWIRATVCAMSHYPPDDMCHEDDDSAVRTTNSSFMNATWMVWLFQGIFFICGVICALVSLDRCRSMRNGYRRINSRECDTELSPNSIIDEMTKLKRHRSWTKMRSYDSAEIPEEIFPTAE